MKKVIVKNFVSQKIVSECLATEDAQAWIDSTYVDYIWGQPAREQRKDLPYEEELWIEDFEKELHDGEVETWVRLRAEYDIEILDITAEYEAEQQEKLDDAVEKVQLKNAIAIFKAGTATNAQTQRAIAYLLKRI